MVKSFSIQTINEDYHDLWVKIAAIINVVRFVEGWRGG